MREPEPLRDDLVEVDEDLAAEQVVELLLARAVLAGEPLQRGDLVGGVVVDVHRAGRRAALADQVDHALDRPPLLRAVVRPERRERARRCRRSPTGTRARARAPRTGRPRCRRRGRRRLGAGSSSNPRAGSGASTFQAWPFARAATCIAAWSRSVSNVRGGIEGGRASSAARDRAAATVAIPARLEPPSLVAPHPRDEAEVVVRPPPLLAALRGSRTGRRSETGSG